MYFLLFFFLDINPKNKISFCWNCILFTYTRHLDVHNIVALAFIRLTWKLFEQQFGGNDVISTCTYCNIRWHRCACGNILNWSKQKKNKLFYYYSNVRCLWTLNWEQLKIYKVIAPNFLLTPDSVEKLNVSWKFRKNFFARRWSDSKS